MITVNVCRDVGTEHDAPVPLPSNHAHQSRGMFALSDPFAVIGCECTHCRVSNTRSAILFAGDTGGGQVGHWVSTGAYGVWMAYRARNIREPSHEPHAADRSSRRLAVQAH
jgi:hypothetical protein